MLKGALFTIGGLATLIGLGLGFLSYWAEGMSDAPGAQSGLGATPGIIVLVGIAIFVGAFFVH